MDGSGAKHNLISPNEATAYLTTNGKSFSRYISILLQRFVHLIKYPRFFKENSPCMIWFFSDFLTNSVTPSVSVLRILHEANGPIQEKTNSFKRTI